MCVRVVVITDIAAVSLCYKSSSCLILLLIINASSITVTTLRVRYSAGDTVTGWTTQRGKREKLESEAHYAALTSEVRDRKEAGRHSTEMFLDYRQWDLLFSAETRCINDLWTIKISVYIQVIWNPSNNWTNFVVILTVKDVTPALLTMQKVSTGNVK